MVEEARRRAEGEREKEIKRSNPYIESTNVPK